MGLIDQVKEFFRSEAAPPRRGRFSHAIAPHVATLKLTHDGFDLAEEDRTTHVAWTTVRRIVAFKMDMVTSDLLVVRFDRDPHPAVMVNEEMEGFGELREKMRELPLADAEWFGAASALTSGADPLLVYDVFDQGRMPPPPPPPPKTAPEAAATSADSTAAADASTPADSSPAATSDPPLDTTLSPETTLSESSESSDPALSADASSPDPVVVDRVVADPVDTDTGASPRAAARPSETHGAPRSEVAAEIFGVSDIVSHDASEDDADDAEYDEKDDKAPGAGGAASAMSGAGGANGPSSGANARRLRKSQGKNRRKRR